MRLPGRSNLRLHEKPLPNSTSTMSLHFNRDIFPPGGWQYYQPETNWSLPNPLNYSFTGAAELIHSHRAANAALAGGSTLAKAMADLENYTRTRLGQNQAPPATAASYEQQPISGCRTCGRKG